jgi:phage major head subunit gpT-like protein
VTGAAESLSTAATSKDSFFKTRHRRGKRIDSLNTPAAVASIVAGATGQKFADNVARRQASSRRLIACSVRAIMYGERVY